MVLTMHLERVVVIALENFRSRLPIRRASFQLDDGEPISKWVTPFCRWMIWIHGCLWYIIAYRWWRSSRCDARSFGGNLRSWNDGWVYSLKHSFEAWVKVISSLPLRRSNVQRWYFIFFSWFSTSYERWSSKPRSRSYLAQDDEDKLSKIPLKDEGQPVYIIQRSLH